ncbi:MAG: IS256 family transposase [Candidatus Eremiobacterota bacterium]
MKIVYPKEIKNTREIEELDILELLAREGARQLLGYALEKEVEEFLGRDRYERTENFRGYRNGYCKARTIGIGYGNVEIKVPRVRDVPKEVSESGYESEIISSYQRSSKTVQKNLVKLYLEGLSSGDFEPVFRDVLGESVGLSSSTILKLKEDWQSEYDEWKRRSLLGEYYAYIWTDGVYIKAGLEREKTALLCVIGVKEDGTKELVSIGEGYRESTASWLEVLRDLKKRGMKSPRLAIGDGALGFWSALRDIYPECEEQRCWNHKVRNVMDKLPKYAQNKAKKRLREIYKADTREQCQQWCRTYIQELREAHYNDAADTLFNDLEQLTTFYNFPKIHWVHIRTTNPIESVFAGVKLRTNVVKRFRKRENGKYMVFKLIQRLSLNCLPVKGKDLLPLLKHGTKFVDGIMVQDMTNLKKAA